VLLCSLFTVHSVFTWIANSSSSIFDDSDADQNYKPFYIKQKATEVCINSGTDCIEASVDSFGNLDINSTQVQCKYN